MWWHDSCPRLWVVKDTQPFSCLRIHEVNRGRIIPSLQPRGYSVWLCDGLVWHPKTPPYNSYSTDR